MMTKNIKNKGFTLIELLAVIVILAVIALIAVPQILNILNRARKSAAEDTTNGIIKSAENYVTTFILKNNGSFPDGTLTFECTTDGCQLKETLDDSYNMDNLTTLDFKGTKPTSGTIIISNSGKNIIANNLNINGFTCIYDGEKSTCGDYKDRVVLSEDFDKKGIVGGYEGVKAIVYLDPTDLSKECNEENSDSTIGVKKGCMKWYAYNDEDGKYTMILDHNTTASTAWNSEATSRDNNEILGKLTNDTIENGWQESLNPRLISAEEIAKICKKTNFDANRPPSSWFYFEDLSQNQETGRGDICSKNGCKYAWLYDRTDYNCTEYGCLNNSNNNNIKDAKGYWTITPVLGYYYNTAWRVSINGSLNELSVHYTTYAPGIRPVITVRKSDLLQ